MEAGAVGALPTLPVLDGSRFGVRRIFCVGQNYASHTREMGGDPRSDPPFFFTKPPDAIVTDGVMPYPPRTSDLHHEVELVVALGGGGSEIPVDHALEFVSGYAVGLDMTRRDLQWEAKKRGRPWDMAKGFDHSAPIALIHPAETFCLEPSTGIEVTVNGAVRQRSTLGEMTWSVPEIIAELSAMVTLRSGDLIFTGTPEGVGPVVAGDRLLARIEGLTALHLRIA